MRHLKKKKKKGRWCVKKATEQAAWMEVEWSGKQKECETEVNNGVSTVGRKNEGDA